MSTTEQNASDSTSQNVVSSKLETSIPEQKTPETTLPTPADNEMEMGGLQSFVSGSAIQKMMSSEGPTVKAVVLRADGTTDEIDYDTTPKKHLVKEILGADPTIVGEYHELQVILVKGMIESLNVPINQHKLRWPFASEVSIRGDILLYRVNDDATPVDFSAEEYKAFAARASEDAQLEAEFNAETEKMDAEAAEMDDDEDDDNDEDMDLGLDEAVMRAQVENMVKRQFVTKFGRDPNDEELASFSEAVMGQFLGSVAGIPEGDEEEEESEEDEEYNPEEDEDQGDDEQEEEEEMSHLVDETEQSPAPKEDETEDKEQDDAAFQDEFAAALDTVRLLAVAQREQILEAAKQQYEEETGEVADMDTLSQAFNLLKVKMNSDGTIEEEEEDFEEDDNEEQDQDEDAPAEQDEEDEAKDASEEVPPTEEQKETPVEEEEEEEEDEDDGEDVEAEIMLSPEQLRVEVESAFEAVRSRGRFDGQKIAAMVSDTFYEINGREADSSEIAAVFSRIKDKLAEEAAEELIYDDDETTNAPPAEEPSAANGDKRDEMVEYARSVVSREMADKARAKFTELANREPSVEEFNELLITLATTRFSDADFEGSDASDDDYNPNDAGEQLTEEKDIQIEAEECVEVDKGDAYDLLGGYDASRSPAKKPVAFFSPMRSDDKPANVNYSVLSDKLMERAVQRFEKSHSRLPTEEEKQKLGKFLTADALTYDLSDDDEVDADYDPATDKSCDENADNALTKTFDAEFGKDKMDVDDANKENNATVAVADVIADN